MASVGGHDVRRAGSTRIGTPDEDADGDSEDDDVRSKRGISERLLNGVNGDCASLRPPLAPLEPADERSLLQIIGTRPPRPHHHALRRRVSHGASTARSAQLLCVLSPLLRSRSAGPDSLHPSQLARISASPDPTPAPTELPFEEHLAFIRTPQGMQEFLLLDEELTRFEGSGFKPVRSAALLPPSAFAPSASTSAALVPPAHKKRKKEQVADLVSRLNPDVLPSTAAPPPPAAVDTPPSSSAPTPAPPPSARPRPRNPDDPLESLWWDVVGPCTTSSSLLFSGSAPPPPPETNGVNGHSTSASSSSTPSGPAAPSAPPALSAGMPHAPWVGYCATPRTSAVGLSASGARLGAQKGKGKARADGDAAPDPAPRGKKRAAGVGAAKADGLGARMRRNCETLRRIRRVGDTLARESTAGEMESPYVSASEGEEDEEGPSEAGEGHEQRPAKRRRARTGLVRVSGIPQEAMRCTATRGTAAREAMRAVGAGVLEHAGFEGTSGGALDVLGHLAGEYLSNLGRTLRFYVDRYSTDLSEKVRPTPSPRSPLSSPVPRH